MERINNLDFIRGLCILYVVFYHMSLTYGLISFNSTNGYVLFNMMSFFMTPFYVFSGYMFSNRRSPKAFVKNKINKLIIPYLFWGAISIIIFYAYQYISLGTIQPLSPFEGFLGTCGLKSNTPLWFFFSLFAVSTIYYFAQRFMSNSKLNIFILLCFVFAYIVHNRMQLFSWGNISLGLVYFHLGHYLKKLVENTERRFLLLLFFGALCIYILINVFDSQNMAFVLLYQREGMFILNLPFSLAACYILWFITSRMRNSNIISWVGKNSLVLFASHRIILNYCYDPIIRLIKPNILYSEYMLTGGVMVAIAYIIFLYALNRYMPKVIGA